MAVKNVMRSLFIVVLLLGQLSLALLLGFISAFWVSEVISMSKIISPNSVGMFVPIFFGSVGIASGIIAIQQLISFGKNCYELLSEILSSA